jgi:DNA-binding HxlR family transcriptional regulator
MALSLQPKRMAAVIDPVVANAVLIAVRQAANVICDRWSLVVLLLAHAGTSRFGDFRAASGMANRQLTGRLTLLEEREILVRLPYSRRPLRYGYHLSHMGLGLFDVFATMARWESQWHPAGGHAELLIEHTTCGGRT